MTRNSFPLRPSLIERAFRRLARLVFRVLYRGDARLRAWQSFLRWRTGGDR